MHLPCGHGWNIHMVSQVAELLQSDHAPFCNSFTCGIRCFVDNTMDDPRDDWMAFVQSIRYETYSKCNFALEKGLLILI